MLIRMFIVVLCFKDEVYHNRKRRDRNEPL